MSGRVGVIEAEPFAIPPDEIVLLVPHGAGHVRAVKNDGEQALLFFEGGKTLRVDAVPRSEAKGRFLYRSRGEWREGLAE